MNEGTWAKILKNSKARLTGAKRALQDYNPNPRGWSLFIRFRQAHHSPGKGCQRFDTRVAFSAMYLSKVCISLTA
jgi:hypothetical protein